MQQRTHRERTTEPHAGPAGARTPLRVGLLVDALRQPAWVARLVAEIEASPFARVVVLARAPADPRREPFFRRLWRGLLHDLYLRLDEGLFPGDPDALAPTDLAPLLPGRPVVEVEADDVACLSLHDLDVAIVLADAFRDAACARVARHGAWSLAGPAGAGTVAPGLVEVLRG
ncbi:MAG TPA: hypothetical protein VFY93_00570, partial [Planctomycetota bacterium]|nr:hypothetical protein [Planctomycetota bacterium]